MIQRGRPVRGEAISKEIREMKDRDLETDPSHIKKSVSPYWVILLFLASLAFAIAVL